MQNLRTSANEGSSDTFDVSVSSQEECKQVEKDATGWTEVTRKKRRKTVQIFVKVNESKAFPLDVSTDVKVEDVMRQVQKVEDAYVTMQGKVLRGNEKLKSCGATDGCTIQVSRMRGGGKHKDKKSQKERKREVKQELPEQKLEEELKRDKGSVIQECTQWSR